MMIVRELTLSENTLTERGEHGPLLGDTMRQELDEKRSNNETRYRLLRYNIIQPILLHIIFFIILKWKTQYISCMNA